VGPFIMDKIDFSQHYLCFQSCSCYFYQTRLFNSKLWVQLHGGAANRWSSSSRVGLAELEPSQTRPYSSLLWDDSTFNVAYIVYILISMLLNY
jgi:hypothetical protein